MGVHKVSAFHPFIFQKSGKSTIIRNLAVPLHFVAYLVFISSIRVDPGPRNRGPTSLLALKIRTLWQTRYGKIKVHRSSACDLIQFVAVIFFDKVSCYIQLYFHFLFLFNFLLLFLPFILL
jgi:hypothetical protein